MEIDIRVNGKGGIDRIRFDEAEPEDGAVFADSIWRYCGDCNVWVSKSTDENAILGIRNIGQAKNLIKAIEKAIDLGWFE